VLRPKYPYLSIIRVLMYLVNNTRLDQDHKSIRYTDVGYLSDPQNVRSQMGYMFLHECYILEVIKTYFSSNVHQSFRNNCVI
jgi:hypothetical protein